MSLKVNNPVAELETNGVSMLEIFVFREEAVSPGCLVVCLQLSHDYQNISSVR